MQKTNFRPKKPNTRIKLIEVGFLLLASAFLTTFASADYVYYRSGDPVDEAVIVHNNLGNYIDPVIYQEEHENVKVVEENENDDDHHDGRWHILNPYVLNVGP